MPVAQICVAIAIPIAAGFGKCRAHLSVRVLQLAKREEFSQAKGSKFERIGAILPSERFRVHAERGWKGFLLRPSQSGNSLDDFISSPRYRLPLNRCSKGDEFATHSHSAQAHMGRDSSRNKTRVSYCFARIIATQISGVFDREDIPIRWAVPAS